MRRLLLVLFVVTGCPEYQIGPRPDEGDGLGDGDDSGFDTGEAIDGEWCNGEDDDGDGLIDEGFPDLDQDGIKDCLDTDCHVRTPEASEVAIDAACGGLPPLVDDPWNAGIEWQWIGLDDNPTEREITVTPVIGNLTDDDGNGTIDELDTPDIVGVAFYNDNLSGTLVAVDGGTGDLIWELPGFHSFGGLAMADIDSDGETEVVGFSAAGYPTAVSRYGDVVWTADTPSATGYPQATVADVDGDGRPEVIADTLLIDGRTGAVLHVFGIDGAAIPYRMPAVGDIDLDGLQEVVIGNRVYSPTGELEWSSPIVGGYGHWTAIADADGDAEGELVMVGAGQIAVYDPDGTALVTGTYGAAQAAPPCVADFDGDSEPELGFSSGDIFRLYELDGEVVWSRAIVDASGLSGCSGYDFDADGTYEVVYADEHTFYIFDGLTGASRFQATGHASGTIWEYPTIADIDADGSAEVVLVSNNRWDISGWAGITVFGHVDDQWPGSGATWHVHDFAVTNVLPDGTIPAAPAPPWKAYNLYRARPYEDEAGVDLQVLIADVCYTGCAGTARALVSVQGINTGSLPSRAEIPVALYAAYGDQRELLDVQLIADPIPPGTATAAFVFDVAVESVGPDGLIVAIDDDGRGNDVQLECNEDNNEDTWLDTPC